MSIVTPLPGAKAQPPDSIHGEAQEVDAEALLLGELMRENSWLDSLNPALTPHDFADPLHARVFELIIDLHNRGVAAHPVTLKPHLANEETRYLARLTGEGLLGMLNPNGLAAQIRSLANRRRVQAALAEALDELAKPDADPTLIMERIVARTASETRATPSLTYEWAGDVQPVLDGAWLIDGFLAKSGPAVMFGHPGCGKTFLALDIAAHVAEGRPWAGRHVEGGPVLYVVAEGVTGFKNRLSALFDNGIMSRAAPFAYIPTPINLQSPDGDIAALIATLKHFAQAAGKEPALVVIDTLSKTFGGAKENTDDMASYVANCERIAAAFNCLTLIIHHRPRDADARNERGHSSLRGGVATSILIEGEETKVATTVKQKDGQEGERVAFQLSPVTIGTNSRGAEVTTCLVNIVDDETEGGAPVSSRRRLTGKKLIAFQALEALIALHGQHPPADIPDEKLDRWKVNRVIDAGQVSDKLKSEFMAGTNADPDKKADTARRTAHRAINDLKSAGILGSWEDWLWLQ